MLGARCYAAFAQPTVPLSCVVDDALWIVTPTAFSQGCLLYTSDAADE